MPSKSGARIPEHPPLPTGLKLRSSAPYPDLCARSRELYHCRYRHYSRGRQFEYITPNRNGYQSTTHWPVGGS